MTTTAKSKRAPTVPTVPTVPAAPTVPATEAKRTPAVACITHDTGTTKLEFVFSDGRKIVVNRDTFPENILETAIWHGLKQKLIDAAALSRNPDTGRSATIGDKYDAMIAVFDRLKCGNWNAVTRGPSGPKIDGTLLMALARLYPTKSVDALREYLGGKSTAEQTAMRGNPRIAPMIATIGAEMAAAANIDFDAQLAGLEDIGGAS